MNTNELVKRLKGCSDGEDIIAVAARIIEECYRTGYVTKDLRIQRFPDQLEFVTKDGVTVKIGDVVYAGENGVPCEISEDGDVPFVIKEKVNDHTWHRYLRPDECYSTKEAAKAAKENQ